jgi:lipid II:glycine glycyltransferase (peptidoglycan interpeptide bridge formation enzyme)
LGKYIWYAPYGPVVIKTQKGLSDFFGEICQKVLEEKGGVFLRIDATPFDKANSFFPLGFLVPNPKLKSMSPIQPRLEWTLDVEKDSKELLAKMHEKTRYSIRLAEKKGVEVIVEDKDFIKYFEIFYSLMTSTAKRNKFSLHAKNYYESVFEYLSKNGGGYLVLTKHENDFLASHFVGVFAGTAYYLFGGTSDEKKNLCGPYLAHWAGILRAKREGLKFYNFGGVEEAKEKGGSWQGITTFKKKFGGETIRHAELLDMVKSKFWYKAIAFAKRFR